MLQNTSVTKCSRWIQDRKHGTFNTSVQNEQIIRRNVQGSLPRQQILLHTLILLVILIVRHQEAIRRFGARRRHVGLAHQLLSKVGSTETYFLPVELVAAAENFLLHIGHQYDDGERRSLCIGELQHAVTAGVVQGKPIFAIPGPCNALG